MKVRMSAFLSVSMALGLNAHAGAQFLGTADSFAALAGSTLPTQVRRYSREILESRPELQSRAFRPAALRMEPFTQMTLSPFRRNPT